MSLRLLYGRQPLIHRFHSFAHSLHILFNCEHIVRHQGHRLQFSAFWCPSAVPTVVAWSRQSFLLVCCMRHWSLRYRQLLQIHLIKWLTFIDIVNRRRDLHNCIAKLPPGPTLDCWSGYSLFLIWHFFVQHNLVQVCLVFSISLLDDQLDRVEFLHNRVDIVQLCSNSSLKSDGLPLNKVIII